MSTLFTGKYYPYTFFDIILKQTKLVADLKIMKCNIYSYMLCNVTFPVSYACNRDICKLYLFIYNRISTKTLHCAVI